MLWYYALCRVRTLHIGTREDTSLHIGRLLLAIGGLEDNDNDYHIVMQSLTNSKNKMVAEIPDPEIAELQGSEFEQLRNAFRALRTKIEELLEDNVTGTFKNFPANTIVTIYGVPFYDCKHGGAVVGASKNFRELHPVLEIN